ncbi:uncharacterized protein LOC117649543 isoform X1 [Thrips palmi]|uniref:Uncharacterized protein LOC117649543 isoform X1 n=1 Tax=Thrips palmi TaxID=161013 RepID=A0A6P8ZTB1_THRPL|nr:uncharacterized protein LOC117649543 isoform X1 [Thrips palmi]XP_034248314.1 uncharacterized protein LOC117649543 isoform X1 [Thrips palmi]XP_034248315.1 uncharacterized protein LOC117649543 isoform X1 [Thrips palmi]XP_034248316.1 uncharacterized protein LOC117649543 isoform X1 [Thrips palmi]XP_034248317.1 uncharacterized protein LOC117649543 isoform X1 [Thrips palmi]
MMKLPLFQKTSSKSESKPSSTKCKHKIAPPDCEIQGSIEIQFGNYPLSTYLIPYFLLSWLPFLLILFLVHNALSDQMESQRLEVASLKRHTRFLNEEVDSLRNALNSFKAGLPLSQTQKFVNENPEEIKLSNVQDLETYVQREKRSVDSEFKSGLKESSSSQRKVTINNNTGRRGNQSRKKLKTSVQARCRRQCLRRLNFSNSKRSGFLALHLKGAHPENVVEAGHVGPWFVDSKAIKESKVSSSFQLREDNESVEIETAGLYFIYAQVYYLTSHALNSYTIMVLPKDSDNPITLAYCSSNAVSSNSTSEVSCYTAVLYTLHVGDRIYVQQREKHRRLIMRSGHSFLGLIKFSGI